MAVLQARDVHHAYGSHVVLEAIALEFEKGQLVSLLGPNGSGKTTFLKILLGLLEPQGGDVIFEGRSIKHIPPRRYARDVAYVPQIHRTAFPYSVEDVVAMGRLPHHSPWHRRSPADSEHIEESLARMGIEHLRRRAYTEISGGERQLTLIARALAQGAHTLIMDEPASALDFGHQIRLLEQLARLSDEGFTCIKSTHAPEHALWFSGRVVLLKDGRVIGDGIPSDQLSAENLHRLYQVRVQVARTDGGFLACVPSSRHLGERS